MSVDNSFLIKKVLQRDHFFACFSTTTRMPFVFCDPVSFEDQVWIFSDMDGHKEFSDRFQAKKIALQGVEVKKASFTGFFASLLPLGVTQVVFSENGASIAIPIGQFVQHKDLSNIPEALRPLENPQLQLTGLYLIQEARRPVPNEEKEDLGELNEEFLVNLARSRFLMPVQVLDGPGTIADKLKNKQVGFINMTMKNGDAYRPIFADSMEFNKFRRQKKEIQAITVPFGGLKNMLPKDVKGYLLNPNGCQIIVLPMLLDQVLANFPDDVKKGLEETRKIAQSQAGPKIHIGPVQSKNKVTQMPGTSSKDKPEKV